MNSESDIMPWDEPEPTLLQEEPLESNYVPPYNLGERTARFGEAVIEFCKKVPLVF